MSWVVITLRPRIKTETKMKNLIKSTVTLLAIASAIIAPTAVFAQKTSPRTNPDCVNWSASGGCLVSIECSAGNGVWRCDYYDGGGYWVSTVSGRY